MADKQRTDAGLRELALFAGAGGGILGGKLLGWRTVCAVEFDPYAASVLVARQNDGFLPPFPIWDDVRSFRGEPWRGIVDVVSGGFPCQDISAAGRGAGIDGERSGLWMEMARIIGEVRPRFAFVENSPMLTSRGLGVVLGDLAAMGFDARWGVLGASDVGAPHKRERIWIVAYSNGMHEQGDLSRFTDKEGWAEQGERPIRPRGSFEDVADPESNGRLQRRAESARQQGRSDASVRGASVADAESGGLKPSWWRGDASLQRENGPKDADYGSSEVPNPNGAEHEGIQQARGRQREAEGAEIVWGTWATEPDVGRVAHGVAARVDRLKAIGNGQVPQCAAEAWRLLTQEGRL
jgi:DNA (cytosine-5)-methyltransferase 1